MLNTFVATPFIPDTRYMIDKLFYPGEGIKYHAVCPTCKTHIGEFCKNNHIIFCQVCEEEINVKDPCYRDFFVTLDITDEIQSIIESNSDYYTTVIAEREQVIDNNLQDIHDGRKYKEFIASLPDDHKKSYLTVIFNSDGSPIFKSAKFSIWPIQIIPNEVPMHVRNQKSIVYSLWFGHDKPNMIYFLRPFVDSMNSLTTNGIVCNINNEIRRIHLYALCCCVDAVARPTMQGTTQFNGYYGCNWCLHPGIPVRYNKGTSVKYTLLNEIPARRTAEQTLQHIQEAVNTNTSVFGIKKASPLLNLREFDIIDGFVPDPMHCMDLGIAKQFAEYWLDSSNMPYSISNSYIDIIDKQIKAFKVPTKLVRLSRSIYHRKYWNAAEWENWLLFYSLPVLSQLPNFQNYVQHWFLLVEGYYLLLQPFISDAELRRADKLLRRFVALTQYYYGESAMSFNVHQVSHLSQSVADWGPLWSHSCYPFESGNGHIIKCVHAAKGVLSQICRTLSIKQSIMMLERHVLAKDFSPVLDYCYYLQNRCTIRTEKFGINRYFGKELRVDPIIINQLNLCIERTRAYGRMVKNKCLFKS
ncbi:uncharacterized protein LOC112457524, partial [Temnothorax curvispinosus]|uniref:Uncharacterized protein LOC112457524 n=1 Tax=Temnothorax curvispinosus TaxID=300111 RepID=A0A6J1Q6A1_9HYME